MYDMKKFLLALVLAVGVFGLIKLTKYQPGGASTIAATTASSVSVTTPTPVATPTPDTSGTTAAPVATATPASTGLKNGTYSGDTVQIGYGPVQVQITVSGGKISAVKMLQVPTDRSRSYQIAQYSTPTLIQETLSAQSATIDSVSGATYTSEGFIQSLQSAISKAS